MKYEWRQRGSTFAGFVGLVALVLAGSRGNAAERFPFESARERIRAAIDARKPPAFAVAVARDGEILWEEAFGLADVERGIAAGADTMFSLASVSKPFTATALMISIERGEIDLDRPVNEYLGTARLVARAGRAEEATVRRVASHTAGLPLHHHFFPLTGPAPPPLVETLRRYGVLLAEPGERWEYSNLGYAVLERALEEVTGYRFATLMEKEVFLPLGMRHTAVVLEPDRETRSMAVRYDLDGAPIPFYDFDHRGASAVYASVRDLLRFGAFHVGTPLAEQRPVISERFRAEMRKPQARMPGGKAYGLGWIVYAGDRGERLVEHGGGMPGVSTLLRLVPSRRIVVAALASSRSDLPGQVADEVLSKLLPRRPRRRSADISLTGYAPEPRRRSGSRPPRRFRGEWEGSVHTHEGRIPILLRLDRDAGLRLEVDARAPVSLMAVGFERNRLTALARERIETGDTPGELLRLSLTRRGDELAGTVTSLGSGSGGLPRALSYWALLKKTEPHHVVAEVRQ